MRLDGLLALIDELPSYGALLRDIQRERCADDNPNIPQVAATLTRAALPFLITALQRDWAGPILVVTAHPDRARQLHAELGQWSQAPDAVRYFPAPEVLFYDKTPWDTETVRQRVALMSELSQLDSESPSSANHPLLVTSIPALMPKTALPAPLKKGLLRIAVNERLDLERFLTSLLRYGYQPTAVVEGPGYFSRRGGIIDLFSPNWQRPLRIELFGDEIDSLRSFDPETQRSTDLVKEATICAATEALPFYGKLAARKFGRADLSGLQALARQRWQQDLENLEYGQAFRGIEFYLPLLYSEYGSLLSFLPAGSLLITEDFGGLGATARQIITQAEETRAELMSEGGLPAEYPAPYLTWDALSAAMLTHKALDIASIGVELEKAHKLEAFGLSYSYGGKLDDLLEDCGEFVKEGQRTVLVSRQTERLADLFHEHDLYPTTQDEITELPSPGSIVLVQGGIESGWTLCSADDKERVEFALLSDTEIFGWAKYRRPRRVRRRSVSPEAFFADLKVGDYVVHIEHGIGVYRGLQRKTIDDVEREYLAIEYAEGDSLFVPVNQADRVTRYVGAGAEPALHRLGTADWDRVKASAEKAVKDIARDLLHLYAARQVVPGHAFAPDTAWQTEMETSFPYQETEDQLDAIQSVKGDMERPRPMDRLVCGDVGYGKTEVALRAAFKAIMDGKQVAFLVPTTVLAQQHYLTFRDRLEPFPIEVEMLSRFRSKSEQARIVERLAAGQIDLIIGTHRLLQKDVQFKDLGLLIIDEEQRFGVVHKERLKQMRSQVDVLTLTATPIPRTLYMALTGARDMSIIDTPPEERLPIRTQVAEYTDSLVRGAILRELSRGGQVYFVHNRVQGIHQVAQRLSRLVPEARIAIGHGQMDEEQLSKIMIDFMDQKYDVLVCTTIIESGLDIPNVNTIIINQADTFGLAQLYQLRGRVGRSSNQAYAYLLYNKDKPLTGIARDRLETIMEASELGAGYRVAMRDLEIRGAGEMLGARQHGQIAAVGFELYTRLLTHAIRELQEEGGIPQAEAHLPFSALSPLTTVKVDLPLSAHIPEDYIEDTQLRLKLYQRMANLATMEDIDQIARELEDRFGPLPEPVTNLIYLLRVRTLATQAGASSVTRDGQRVQVRFESADDFLPLRAAIIQHFGNIAQVRPNFFSLPWGRGGELSQQTLLEILEATAAEAVKQHA